MKFKLIKIPYELHAVVGIAMLLPFLFFLRTVSTQAVSASEWQAGNIIDDSLYYDNNSMSSGDIQNFLNSKMPECDTDGSKIYSGSQTRAQYGASRGYPAPYTCLKDFSQNGMSAATIIKIAADTYRVSPKTLLVMLQKEQSLVTDDWPWPNQYRSAMGYGCPDTAPCDAEYYGFYNQVTNAARQIRRYATYPNEYTKRAYQNNYIQYNPNAGCGGSNVYIENAATAGLYIYTPYQPNISALNNLYGSGDACGAYGNRNFWRLFSDWFGPTTGYWARDNDGDNLANGIDVCPNTVGKPSQNGCQPNTTLETNNVAGDFNGDGYGDVLVFSVDPNGQSFNIWLFPGTTNGLGNPVLQRSLGPNSGGWSYESTKPVVTNVNNDGYDDLVIFHKGPNNEIVRHVLRGSASGIQASDSNAVAWLAPNQGWLWTNVRFVGGGDFNGDSFGDILAFSVNPQGTVFSVWSFYGTSSGTLQDPGHNFDLSTASGGWSFASTKPVITNYNNDAYEDLVIFHKGPNNEIVRHILKGSGNGIQTSDANLVTWLTPNQGWLWTNVRFVGGGDFNGDSYGDILALSVDPNGQSFNVWAFPGNGATLGNPVLQRSLGPSAGGWSFSSSKPVITNVDNDAYEDLVIFHKGPNNEIVRHVLRGSASGIQASEPSWVAWQFPNQGWLWTNVRLISGS